MKKELVTVVVPAYNHEPYIKECLESVVSQDYDNLEIIVINDGSTDGTGQVIEEFIKTSKREIKYISKENEGLIKSLNMGLKEGRGKYFCQIASDDRLTSHSISDRVSYLENNSEVDCVFSLAHHDKSFRKKDKKIKEPFISKDHNLSDILSGRASIMFPTGMFKRQVLINLGSFDEDFRYFEDLHMKYLLTLKANIGYLGKEVMYYRTHESNVSKSRGLELRKEKVLSLEKILNIAKDKATSSTVKQYLFFEYLKLLKGGKSFDLSKDFVKEIFKKSYAINPYSLKLNFRYLKSFLGL